MKFSPAKVNHRNNQYSSSREKEFVTIKCPKCDSPYQVRVSMPAIGCTRECSRVGKFATSTLKEVVRRINEVKEKDKLVVDNPTSTPYTRPHD